MFLFCFVCCLFVIRTNTGKTWRVKRDRNCLFLHTLKYIQSKNILIHNIIHIVKTTLVFIDTDDNPESSDTKLIEKKKTTELLNIHCSKLSNRKLARKP